MISMALKVEELPFKKRIPFARLFPNANPTAVNLLEKLLTFNPYYDSDDEPDASPIPDSFFVIDRYKEQLTKKQLKQMLYDEITH
ncbi:hypothetical protein G6F37_003899 [Rhizopus arrhizus]|nr:hypothetical protein G6F38_004078 [Rhizopus arrhizus]KAG1160538.1 hypothetical protein G6F37_003899 [Rhizopus arrhizus]